MYTYDATVERVVDGDTIVLLIELERANTDFGFGIYETRLITRREVVRLYGVDTPELVGADRAWGLEAKRFVEEAMPPGTRVVAHTVKPRDKYGRYLAAIWYGGRNLADDLVANGLARPYDGGTRGGTS